MMKLQALTTSEEEIMLHIWRKGNIYFRELMASFPEPKPHQNTVSTFLKILVEKNYLKAEKQGRIYHYSPLVSQEEYKRFVTLRFIDHYYHSAEELVDFLKAQKLIENTVPQKEILEKEKPENPVRKLVEELTSSKKKKKEKDKKKKKKKKKGDA